MIRLGTIRARILLLFLLSVGAFGGAMGYILPQLRTIGDSLESLERGYLPLTPIIANMEFVLRQIERDEERFVRESLRADAGHRSNAALRSAQLEDAAESARRIAAASARISRPGEQRELRDVVGLIDDVDEARQAHDAAFEGWMAAAPDAPTGQSLSALSKARTELSLAVSRLAARVEARIAQVSATTARARERTTAVTVTLATLATLFAAVLAGMALVTLRPIGRLTREVQRLGAGEYSGPVQLPPRGVGSEVAVLAREFNAMAAAVVERDRRLSERAAALDQLSLRLRQILDTIQAGLVVTEDHRIALVNPAAEATWDVAAGGALPDWMADLGSGRHDAVVLGDRVFDVVVVPFGARGVLYVGEDVTEREAVRERLARAERLAVVGQMLAQITHEVRNPLNAMSLNTELLADDIDPDSESGEILATITAEIRRLEALTGRYLSLSRRRQPERSPEDPAAMVREILRQEEAALRLAGVAVTHTVAATRLVELDSDPVRRALRNILLNAVEAGAHSVSIDTTVGDDQLTIVICDDGPGMSTEELKQAFEPFFTTKAQGTGLGLAISRQEIEDIGGTLRCISAPGDGTTFTLACPL
ncbi:MAG: signal transduction histidine kinase [Myxococcota bacterium]